jgi:hypothetical protein
MRERAETDVDLEALLCALVLAPRTFARNRFYPLFTDPPARRVRRRAAQIRTMVRHLAGREGAGGDVMEIAQDGERVRVRYRIAPLRFERTMLLDALEIAIVRFALDRAAPRALAPGMALSDEDRRRVEEALAKLGKRLDEPSNRPPVVEEGSPGSFSPGEL